MTSTHAFLYFSCFISFIYKKRTVFSSSFLLGMRGPSRLRPLHMGFFIFYILFTKLFLVPNYGLGRMDLTDYDDYTIDQDFNELSEELGDDKV